MSIYYIEYFWRNKIMQFKFICFYVVNQESIFSTGNTYVTCLYVLWLLRLIWIKLVVRETKIRVRNLFGNATALRIWLWKLNTLFVRIRVGTWCRLRSLRDRLQILPLILSKFKRIKFHYLLNHQKNLWFSDDFRGN